ncbi:MAG: DNA-methyltransferase [Candidatus Pacearchaeota archaeon]
MKDIELWEGDCLGLMDNIPDNYVNMILADLPYGTTRNKWDSMLPLDDLWKHYKRIIKPNGAIVLFGQDKFSARLMLSNEEWHRYNLIWKKGKRTSGFLNAKRMPLRNHEDILIFYNRLPTFNPQFTEGQPLHGKGNLYKMKDGKNNNYGKFDSKIEDVRKGTTQKYPISVLDFDRPHPPIHPTQKPVELLGYLIRTFSNEGDIVLDNTMGVGSTGVASKKEKRKFIGIEKEKPYFDIAVDRING